MEAVTDALMCKGNHLALLSEISAVVQSHVIVFVVSAAETWEIPIADPVDLIEWEAIDTEDSRAGVSSLLDCDRVDSFTGGPRYRVWWDPYNEGTENKGAIAMFTEVGMAPRVSGAVVIERLDGEDMSDDDHAVISRVIARELALSRIQSQQSDTQALQGRQLHPPDTQEQVRRSPSPGPAAPGESSSSTGISYRISVDTSAPAMTLIERVGIEYEPSADSESSEARKRERTPEVQPRRKMPSRSCRRKK